jgi:hypothetical protein
MKSHLEELSLSIRSWPEEDLAAPHHAGRILLMGDQLMVNLSLKQAEQLADQLAQHVAACRAEEACHE